MTHNLRHLAPTRRVVIVFLFLCAAGMMISAPAYGASIIALPDIASNLPLVRWGDGVGNFFSNQGLSITNAGNWLTATQRDTFGGNTLALASFLWQTSLNFMSQALTMNILDFAAQQIDDASHLLGRVVWGGGAVSIGLASLVTVAAIIWILMQAIRGTNRLIRDTLPRLFALALILLLTLPSGMSHSTATDVNGKTVATGAGTARVGTAVWYIDTVNDVSTTLASPMLEVAGVFDHAKTQPIQRDADGLSCALYVDQLKKNFQNSTVAGIKKARIKDVQAQYGAQGTRQAFAALNQAKNLVDDEFVDKYSSLVLSQMWEDSVAITWSSIQFGDSPLQGRVYCRVLDDRSGIPPSQQWDAVQQAAGPARKITELAGGTTPRPFRNGSTAQKLSDFVGFAYCLPKNDGTGWANTDDSLNVVWLANLANGSDAETSKALQGTAKKFAAYWDRIVDFFQKPSLTGFVDNLIHNNGVSLSIDAVGGVANVTKAFFADSAITAHQGTVRPATDVCKEWFTSTDASDAVPPEFAWDNATVTALTRDLPSGNFLRSLSGIDAGTSTIKGTAALVSSLLAFIAFGALSLGVFAAKLALGIHAIMLPILLLISILPGQNTGQKLAATGKTFLGYGVVATIATALLAIIMIMVNVLNTVMAGMVGRGNLFAILWVGFSPAICIWVLSKLAQKFGIPNPLSVKGALAWGSSAGGLGNAAAGGLAGGALAGGIVNRARRRAGNFAANTLSSTFGNKFGNGRTGGRGRAGSTMPARGTSDSGKKVSKALIDFNRSPEGVQANTSPWFIGAFNRHKTHAGSSNIQAFRDAMAEKTSYGRRATAYRHTLQATGSESLARQARRQQIRATIGAGISTMARIGAKTLTAGALATMGPVGLAGSAALAYSEVQRFKEHLNENVMRRRDLLYSDYMNRLAREDAVQSVAATREGDKMGVGNTGDGQSSSHGTGTATASGEKQSVDTPQYRSDGTPPNEDLASHSVLSSCRR